MILINKVEFNKLLDHLKIKLRNSNVEPEIDILNWVKAEARELWTGYLINELKIEVKIRELDIEKTKYNSFEEFDEVINRANQIARLEWLFNISDDAKSEPSKYEVSMLAYSINDQLIQVREAMGLKKKQLEMDLNDEQEDFSNFHTN